MPESNFEYAVRKTLTNEGIFSDHFADPGGKTKYGITEGTLIRFLGKHPDFPCKAIWNLERDQAVAIYKEFYWDVLHLDQVQDRYVAAEIFDTGVNCGPSTAVLLAQRAYNTVRKTDWAALNEDGAMGPVTLAALNNTVQAGYRLALLGAMNGEQYDYYKLLVSNNPIRFRNFIRGWMKRAVVNADVLRREGLLDG